MLNPFRSRPLTRGRIALAIAIAGATDALQIGLGPLGWAFLDEGADVVAMILISALIGFHPLLLPTFVIEFFPIVDMVPTWTACVGAVVLLRRRVSQAPVGRQPTTTKSDTQTPPESSGPVIDV